MGLSPVMLLLLNMATARLLSPGLNATDSLNATVRCGLPGLAQAPEAQHVLVVVESCSSRFSMAGYTNRCYYDRNRTLVGGEMAVVGSGDEALLVQQRGDRVCFAWGTASDISGASGRTKDFECMSRCLSFGRSSDWGKFETTYRYTYSGHYISDYTSYWRVTKMQKLLPETEASGGAAEVAGAADLAATMLKFLGYFCLLSALVVGICWPCIYPVIYRRCCQPKSSAVDEQPAANPDSNAIEEQPAASSTTSSV